MKSIKNPSVGEHEDERKANSVQQYRITALKRLILRLESKLLDIRNKRREFEARCRGVVERAEYALRERDRLRLQVCN